MTATARHADDVQIDYTNWRGERRERIVRPIGIMFGETKHHPKRQWLMWAIDINEQGEEVLKAFAMEGIHSLKGIQ